MLTALEAVLPAAAVVGGTDRLAAYRSDEARWVQAGMPAAAVLPRTTDEVSAALRVASELGVPVVPRGAGTGLSGGAAAIDGCIVLCTARMDSIEHVDADDQLAVVQAGVVTADLDAAAARVGLWYPPDPSSWRECTVGGNIATNAGGLCCVRYGTTSAYVLGLEVVLADGSVLRTGGRTVKGVAGYDVTRLMVGSEGTLGVVTRATVRLRRRRRVPGTVVAFFPDLVAAGAAVIDVLAAPLATTLLEIMDRTTIAAVDDLTRMGLDRDAAALLVAQVEDPGDVAVVEAVFTSAGATSVHASSDEAEADLLLEARRLSLPALQRRGTVLLDDVAVPRTALPRLITAVERAAADIGLTIGTFGHAGDGNLHPTIVYDAGDPGSCDAALAAFDTIVGAALELGGTITGEHGVGVLKAGWLEREVGATALRVQRSLKAALDPRGLLNPGKVLLSD